MQPELKTSAPTPAKRRRGRPANPVLTPPTDSVSARALLSLLLTQSSVRVRVLASAERLAASFMQAEAIERENTVNTLRDELNTARAEIDSLKAENESLRRNAIDSQHSCEMSSRHAGIVESENTRLKQRVAEFQAQIDTMKRAQSTEPRARPPEIPFDPVACDAEMKRLDIELKKQEAELKRRRMELI